MKVVLQPGDKLVVDVDETDGEFIIEYKDEELCITAAMPDSSGREGVTYSEKFGEADRLAMIDAEFEAERREIMNELSDTEVGAQVYELRKLLAKVSGNDNVAETINSNTRFKEDLEFDSLSMIELIITAEQEWGVELEQDALQDAKTVGEFARLVLLSKEMA